MPVGEYGGVALQDTSDTWRNGAVFLLRKAARAPASVSLNGWVTTVVRNQKVVITCGPSTSTGFDATFAESLNAANQALDYMSVRGQADCVICDALDDCLVWWLDAALGGVVMRCRAIQSIGVTISATAEVRDANGNLKPSPPPPTPMVNDVFRFVRMSRTSDDLFDSYRNLFLAFESLLSDIRPRRRISIPQQKRKILCWNRRQHIIANTRWEFEHDWFMGALDQADKLVPLDLLTPPGVTNHKKWINRWMYSAERSALMHAKRGQNYLLPHDVDSRADLIQSIARLWEYIKNLIEEHLNVQHLHSYLSLYAVEQMSTTLLQRVALVVSDDDSGPVNPVGENLISPAAAVVELQSSTPIAADPDDPELWTKLAYRDAADLAGLTPI